MTDSGAGGTTFTTVYRTILSPSCRGCHGDDVPGMNFATQAGAYSSLVGVSASGSACGRTGDKRVVAGDSASSLLYTKVAGTPPCGSRMPERALPLSQTNIDLIKSWIDEGAPNN